MFNLDPVTLMLSLFFGIIGYAYYVYGKKQSSYFLISGIGLMVFPYFVESKEWTFGIGALLMAVPFVMPKD